MFGGGLIASALCSGGKQDSSGGSDNENWQPPDWWIPVPEPQAYEMYFLIQVYEMWQASIGFVLSRPEDTNTGNGSIAIDWGDGSGFSSDGGWNTWNNLAHKYNDTGQYLIKITASEGSCFLQTFNAPVLIAKLGAEIVLNNDSITGGGIDYLQRAFYGKQYLHWAVINCKSGLPRDKAFQECYALKRVDMAVPPAVIGDDTFVQCRSLEKFDFSHVVTIKTNIANQAGFKKINAPLCTSVGDSAFVNCYNLQEVTFAEDCVFGNNCFSECYSLYPRPDGSVN